MHAVGKTNLKEHSVEENRPVDAFRLELRARYADGVLSLHRRTGEEMTTVALDRLDPIDALDLMEMGFGDPGRIAGLPTSALDEALDREGWDRATDWDDDGEAVTATVVRR